MQKSGAASPSGSKPPASCRNAWTWPRACAPRPSAGCRGCRSRVRNRHSKALHSPPRDGGGNGPMIISLRQDADAAMVLTELVARGLWVTAVERSGTGASVHYVIGPHSAAANPDDLARIDGILEV